jgi:hypothetical protein
MRNKFLLTFISALTAVLVLVAAGLVLGAAWFNPPAAQAQAPAPGTITVVGEGKVKGSPDMAQANIGVEVFGFDITQATNEAAQIMEQVMAALKAQGVAESDIQTSYYNVWVERPYAPDGSQSTEVIYHVNNNLLVTIRDLTQVTTILGAAIEAGANSINGVTFSIADPSALQSQARQLAVENGKATAEELAALNGVTLGQVVSVSEVISSGVYPYSDVAAVQGYGGGGAGPIVPGEVEISTQLQIAYAIE